MDGSSYFDSKNEIQVVEVPMFPVNKTKKISFEVRIEKMRPKIVEKEVQIMAQKAMKDLGIDTVSELEEKRHNLAERIREQIAVKFPEKMALEINGLKVEVKNIRIP